MNGKFKDLSFKEKIEYIGDYYKIHIAVFVIILFTIGYIINSVFINPPKKPYVSISYLGEYLDGSVLEDLEAELNSFIPLEMQSGYKIEQNNFYEAENAQLNMALSQKYVALIMSEELDIIITNHYNYNELLSQNSLAVLGSKLLNNTNASELLSQNGNIYGINASESLILKKYNINLPVICIMGNSRRVENAEDIIMHIDKKIE